MINDHVHAQGAVLRMKQLREGIAAVSRLVTDMPKDWVTHLALKESMASEADRLEMEVQAWCDSQESPREAMSMAHRRFWELDMQGRMLERIAAEA